MTALDKRDMGAFGPTHGEERPEGEERRGERVCGASNSHFGALRLRRARKASSLGSTRAESVAERGPVNLVMGIMRIAVAAQELLTLAVARFYSVSMNAGAGHRHAEQELERLERRLDELLVVCRQFQDENASLKQRQSSLVEERARLIRTQEQARTRVEAMISRLKSMEASP